MCDTCTYNPCVDWNVSNKYDKILVTKHLLTVTPVLVMHYLEVCTEVVYIVLE